MAKTERFEDQFLNISGQIVNFLMDGPVRAGDIYKKTTFSQPSVSLKLARLQDQGVIFCYRDGHDNRVIWYQLTDKFIKRLLLERDKQVLRRGIFC
jgi:DNA-binding MarR family transcriptional regulator